MADIEDISDSDLEMFEEVLGSIVDADGSWRDKKAAIEARLSDDAKSHLEELAGWFDE